MSLSIPGETKGSSGWNIEEQEFPTELMEPVLCWTHEQKDLSSKIVDERDITYCF
jgi:hypothetical protein